MSEKYTFDAVMRAIATQLYGCLITVRKLYQERIQLQLAKKRDDLHYEQVALSINHVIALGLQLTEIIERFVDGLPDDFKEALKELVADFKEISDLHIKATGSVILRMSEESVSLGEELNKQKN